MSVSGPDKYSHKYESHPQGGQDDDADETDDTDEELVPLEDKEDELKVDKLLGRNLVDVDSDEIVEDD